MSCKCLVYSCLSSWLKYLFFLERRKAWMPGVSVMQKIWMEPRWKSILKLWKSKSKPLRTFLQIRFFRKEIVIAEIFIGFYNFHLVLATIFFFSIFPYHLKCQVLFHFPFAYKQAVNQKEALKPQRNGNSVEEKKLGLLRELKRPEKRKIGDNLLYPPTTSFSAYSIICSEKDIR